MIAPGWFRQNVLATESIVIHMVEEACAFLPGPELARARLAVSGINCYFGLIVESLSDTPFSSAVSALVKYTG